MLETLEDRLAPAVGGTVTIAALQHGAEAGTDGIFRVSRDSAAGDLIVHYSLDAASTAGSGADFSALNGSVTILDGASYSDIYVVPIDDAGYEGPETIQLNLSVGEGYYGTYSIGSPNRATLTIADDDANPVSLTNPGDQACSTGDPITLALSAADSANDLIFSVTGLPAGLSIDSTGTITGTIPNTFESGGQFVVTVTATDCVNSVATVSQTFNWVVDCYPAYLDAVSQADDEYADDLTAAATERDTDIYAARALAQTDAYNLYATYESQVADANQTYAAAVASAEAGYESAVQSATAASNSAYAQAEAIFEAAIASADSAFDNDASEAEQTYQNAAAALAAANAATSDASTSATATTEQAYADALAAYQANYDQAGASWSVAMDAAFAVLQAAGDAADTAWAVAETVAWITRVNALNDADTAVVGAEASAWNACLGVLAARQSNLDSAEAGAQSQFELRAASALSRWSTRESTAWTSYSARMATIPGAPALGQPVLTPRPVQVCSIEPSAGLVQFGRIQEALAGRREYVVRNPQGESMLDIAARQLGDRDRWTEIYRLNQTLQVTRIGLNGQPITEPLQPQYPIPFGTSLRVPGDALRQPAAPPVILGRIETREQTITRLRAERDRLEGENNRLSGEIGSLTYLQLNPWRNVLNQIPDVRGNELERALLQQTIRTVEQQIFTLAIQRGANSYRLQQIQADLTSLGELPPLPPLPWPP